MSGAALQQHCYRPSLSRAFTPLHAALFWGCCWRQHAGRGGQTHLVRKSFQTNMLSKALPWGALVMLACSVRQVG